MSNQNLSTPMTISAPGSLPALPNWITAWRAGFEVEGSRAAVQELLDAAREAILPTNSQTLAVLMAKYLPIFHANVPKNWAEQRTTYMELLADLPPDLLAKGFLEAAKTSTFFPRPADIRRTVEAEFNERTAAVKRMEFMLSDRGTRWPEPGITVTPEEKAAALKVYQDFMAGQATERKVA